MHKNLPNFFVFVDHYNNKIFQNNSTDIGIIYRNYNSSKREIELNKIAIACKRKRYKLFISNDMRLVIKFKADGIYVPAFNKTKRFSNLERKNLIVLGSAHNQREIKEKIFQNCKAIFLSPAFNVKKAKKFLGIHKFNSLSCLNNIKIFALGGIGQENIKKLKLFNNIEGFGGIGIFKKKPAYKRPVFVKNYFF